MSDMVGQSGAATQPSRAQYGSRVHAPRMVAGHTRLIEGTRMDMVPKRNLGPTHDVHASHAVVWDRDPRTAMRIGNALRRQAHTVHVVQDPAALHRCMRHDEPDVVIVGLDELDAVLDWLLRATGVLCPVPRTGEWRAYCYETWAALSATPRAQR